MLARFFIDRPVLAWVISIVIVLLGALGGVFLPIAEYPDVTPPAVRVVTSYPGANAKVVAESVAAPIEQQVNGVENMLYMTSQSNNDGSYTLDVTFALGTDINEAQVMVQNRVAIAEPVLPDVVRAIGVSVKKQSPDILMGVSLYSEKNPDTDKPYYDQLYMSNYATIQLKDALARVDGVGDVMIFGQQDYSMRVWLDPDRLQARGLTVGDVIRVLREQNVQVAAGKIGQPPVPTGQDFQYTLSTQGRLTAPEQFSSIVVQTGGDGQVTYLADVARVELGARSQDVVSRLDGQPSSGLGIFLLPGANALATSDLVKSRMQELEKLFPKGLRYAILYDTTPFIRESVDEVFHTLIESIILVALVVLLFLQDWKAVMLPVIDVVVSLVGTFAVMHLMGFSLNNLTLFGLVLAIGIVVDDAIVVLENIERWLEQGLSVREATIRAMTEITGPVLAITLVLSSVLLPSAFLGGITGQFFRQFALTISVSMLISAINALTMTPARAAWIFGSREQSPHGEHDPSKGKEPLPWWIFGLIAGVVSVQYLWPVLMGDPHATETVAPSGIVATFVKWGISLLLFLPGALVGGLVGWFIIGPVNAALGVFFRWFNSLFARVTELYGHAVSWCLRLSAVVLLIYVGLIGLTAFGLVKIPSGFVPPQDKGYLIASIQLPDASSLERTLEATQTVQRICLETPGVGHTVGIPGQSFVLNAVSSNYGSMFIILKPFHERRTPELRSDVILGKLRARLAKEVPEARVLVFGPPAVRGLGNAGGFKMMVQATGEADLDALQAAANKLAMEANQQPGLVGVFNTFSARSPQLYVNIDREKVKTMDVPLSGVFEAMQTYLGGFYVNDFNRFGRTWQVNVQADAKYRVDADAVRQLKVRSAQGDMVPLGAVAEVEESSGPVQITRFNMLTSASIVGASTPTMSTGEVLATMERLGDKLPRGMTYQWSELSFLQKQATQLDQFQDLQQNPLSAFVLGSLLVFFVLAGLYESWSLPLAVILVVPMCILSALAGVWIRGLDNNLFTQIGFVVLVGLACKNAILIVEFARDREEEGANVWDAALEAAKVRLRPIVMTTLCFIHMVPPYFASGAGAEMRISVGTAMLWGAFGVTAFGIFLTPVFFAVIRGLFKSPPPQPRPADVSPVQRPRADLILAASAASNGDHVP